MEVKTHGAVGNGAKEKDINLGMAVACRDLLVASGVEVRMSRITDVDEGLQDKINRSNTYKPDVTLDIHNNAGRGKGFEVFITGNNSFSRKVAESIESEVKKIGQNSRGVKVSKNLSFLNRTVAPALLTEGFFLDNKEDFDFGIKRVTAFGQAYARGILKALGVVEKPTTPSKPAYPGKMLVKGTTDKANTRVVQQRYNDLGFNVVVDGIFGNQTEAVTKTYQKNNKLVVDGKVGLQTWGSLFK